jgi:predicted DNA-binding transcriptional regulator YafY
MPYYNSDAPGRAARLVKIVHLVASRRPGDRIGRERLARECECTVKTIQRDIQCLQSAHIPLEYDAESRSYTIGETGWSFSATGMTGTDVMALAIARGLLASAPSALPFAPQVAEALEKATVDLPPSLRAMLEEAANALSDQGGSARDYSRAPVGTLLDAISRRQTVEMLYESRSSRTRERRRVDPYRLSRRDGRYFELNAWCHRRQEVRTFALDRIYEVRFTGERFTVRAWDDSDEGIVGGLRGGALIPVEVRFDRQVAPYARERRWSFKTTFTEDADGATIMRGMVRGTEGILRELLGWMRHAEVLGGPELRARMADEVAAMAALYTDR